MSVSIYYTATRDQPLTPVEQSALDAAVARFAVEDQLVEYCRTGDGANWESFCVDDPTDPTEPGVIFEGSTKLPDNTEHALWQGLQHWCQLLSIIRHNLPGAIWRVHADDHDIVWDDARGEFDPSQ